MKTNKIVSIIIAGAIAGLTATGATANNPLSVSSSTAVITYDAAAGTFDLRTKAGDSLITGAHVEAAFATTGGKSEVSFAGAQNLSCSSAWIKDSFGTGGEIRCALPGADELPDVTQIIRSYKGKSYFITYLEISNRSAATIRIDRVLPVAADSKAGASILPASSPDSLVILENGHKNRFDFWVRMIRATGESDSNWTAALYDLNTGRALIGGFLTQETSLGSIYATPGETGGGLGSFGARAVFSPFKRIKPGAKLKTDALYLQYEPKDAVGALETLGRTIAATNKLPKPPINAPVFWDTWYSHYNDSINENIVLRNLDVVSEKLKPYGVNTFEIDAGWQDDTSDWMYNKERFPNGMKYVADKIRVKGLKSAIWIAPFMLGEKMPVVIEHPDWFLEMATYGKALMPKDKRALDVSNPQAQQWLRDVIGRIAREWGFDILKVDFTYYSLEGKSYNQPGRTRTELFREAYRIIRDAAGPGKMILAVGVPVGYHAGVVDYMRTGLDNAPRWGTESGYATQGTLPSYRSMIRRWFLNGAVWMNDPDDVYTGYEPTFKRWNQPVQPRNELLAWISAVGLTGQMIEFADEPASMNPERLSLVRSIMPVYGAGARPVDLFLKEHPEILDLPVTKPEKWHVVGMFNWGVNKTMRGEEINGTREMYLKFADLGLPANGSYRLYDFWERKYLGEYKISYVAKLPPRSVRVVAVHPALARPQFLGTNRHITMGATDIAQIRWDGKTKALSGKQSAVAGFEYDLAFYVPKGYELKSAKAGGKAAKTVASEDGRVLNLFFKPAKTGSIEWSLTFGKPTKKTSKKK